MDDDVQIHAPGMVNRNWPLCLEVDARGRGWTPAEIEDGELADDPLISGVGDEEWWSPAPVDCRPCLELVHA
jgi:hypothetical protein